MIGLERGGGIACLMNNKLNWSSPTEISDISNQNLEMLTILIHRPYQPPLYVTTVYIPPSANIKAAITYLDDVANLILTMKCIWILGGDMNIDLLDQNHNSKLKALSHFISNNQLNQLIKKPTRTTSKPAP